MHFNQGDFILSSPVVLQAQQEQRLCRTRVRTQGQKLLIFDGLEGKIGGLLVKMAGS